MTTPSAASPRVVVAGASVSALTMATIDPVALRLKCCAAERHQSMMRDHSRRGVILGTQVSPKTTSAGGETVLRDWHI